MTGEVSRPPGFRVVPMTAALAQAIATWRYRPPYDVYDSTAATERLMLDPSAGYAAVLGGDGELLGFCCFGAEAQVAGGAYPPAALDAGAGMRPDLTRQGMGADLIGAIVGHAARIWGAVRLCVSIAVWNERSRRAAATAGFVQTAEFHRGGRPAGERFVVMERDASNG